MSEGAALSPSRLFWRQFRRSPVAIAGGVLLSGFYLIATFAPFFAPYAQEAIDKQRFFHPPHRVHWLDQGRWRGPFIRPMELVDPARARYAEDESRVVPLRWFVRGSSYRLLGVIPSNLHLFGVESGERVYLLGADPLGRDLLSRLLYGSQISLTVGLVGISISFSIGLLLGGVAGYFGGWIDSVIMRFTELLLTIPGLYLIVALRSVFPTDLPSQQVYLAIVAILAFIGWAGLARIIRGMVLSIRRSEYVTAAEALGMSRLRIIARHILPNTMSFVIVAATIAIPGYILGEVFLSFLGVGVQEPSCFLGQHAESGAEPARAEFLPLAAVRAGHRHLPDRDGVQLPGRRPARRARPAQGPRRSEFRMRPPLLEVRDLQTHFFTDEGVVRAVDGVSFELNAGETLAVVGESGSGKSVTSLSILRLVAQPPGRIVGGQIRFQGRNLLDLAPREMRAIRGKEISMIFQEPMTSLNPVYTCGEQIIEAIVLHEKVDRRAARQRTIEMLQQVGIPSPEQRVDEYPHQMSGGMRQRVMIAMALACRPAILIADEPTTALDVTIQAQILELLKRLQRELGMAVLLITHDLGVVAETADRVAVMYAGQVVEYCDVASTFQRPLHPYTAGLQASLPRLGAKRDRCG